LKDFYFRRCPIAKTTNLAVASNYPMAWHFRIAVFIQSIPYCPRRTRTPDGFSK
jgi:hypothetical protein